MDKNTYINLRDIAFSVKLYHKNFDLIVTGEHIISEYEGKISKLRILERENPIQIGEFSLSVWDIQLGKMLNVNLSDLFSIHANEMVYDEFYRLVQNEKINNVNEYNKIIFIHSFILHEEYRKHEITEEFIEFIHRTFYDKYNLIVAMVIPFQYNDSNYENYLKDGVVTIKKDGDNPEEKHAIMEYYSLEKLMNEKTDEELNEIKLFSVAARCGFTRIDESHIFKYEPKKIIDRLKDKWGKLEKEEKGLFKR